ncbi:MAG: hypothetical protein PHC62_00555 [Candidatus Izemoplasmatales bacterium]|nr:hypothetical protein [Candidatus Izemoplasmatales bacterium]
MSYDYTKQNWKTYDKTLPSRLQDDSVITKKRLDHMEDGIEKNSMSLEIGDLIVGDSATPDASIEIDEDSKSKKLNIIFPKFSDIDDNTIKDTASWSSRKIRTELDKLAANAHYTCEVMSGEGFIFASPSDVKTLTARILKTGEDITSTAKATDLVWTRKSKNADYDTFWNGKHYTGKNVTVSANEMNDTVNATFYCAYNGTDTEGAAISATGSITLSNMIFEPTNTSISFNIFSPEGTIFDNRTVSTITLEAIAYEGSNKLTDEDATFRWYVNGIWVQNASGYTLSLPISSIALSTTITCEMRYNLATYRNSITLQNRKNVIVSETVPNDPRIGDIWYMPSTDIYSKWTGSPLGWQAITNLEDEVSGDQIIAVEAVKTSYETMHGLEQLRRSTYYETIDGEKKYISDFYNEYRESADETVRTLTAISQEANNALQISSSAAQTAERFSWLVSGTDETSFELTENFASLISRDIVLTGDNIKLNGMTSINGAVQITTEGYLIATEGGRIGPWNIGENEIYWEDPNDGYTSVYIGKSGINLSNNLVLSPSGGIDSRNFKVEANTDRVEINAETLRVNDVDVINFNHTFGIRNMILTSGDYQVNKPMLWELGEIPWTMTILPENLEAMTVDDVAKRVTYLQFKKGELQEEQTEENQYIRLPLSEVPAMGRYSFCFRAFGSTSTNDPLVVNVYLMTEDLSHVKRIASMNIALTTRMYDIVYDQLDNIEYKYIGFKSTDFQEGDTFNLINMGLYNSLVKIRDWQPAPEDLTVNEFENDNSMRDYIEATSMRFEIFEDAMAAVFQTEQPKILTEEDVKGMIAENDSLSKIMSEVDEKIVSVQASIDGLSTEWRNRTIIKGLDSEGNPMDIEISDLFQYINLYNGAILLGNNASPVKLRIFSGDDTEDANISFSNETGTLATFKQNRLEVEEVQTNAVTLGNFKFFARENGNLSIKKTGQV